MKPSNNHINYIEFKSTDLNATKKFYTACFDWEFTDYGPTYSSFEKSGISGGFEFTKGKVLNGVLIALVHRDLPIIKKIIIENGGSISKEIFSFPGGERFQFLDPSGNELAVWKEN